MKYIWFCERVTWGLRRKGQRTGDLSLYTPGLASIDLYVSSMSLPPLRHSVNVHFEGRRGKLTH